MTVQSVMFKMYVINYLWFQKYGIIIRLMCPVRSQLFLLYCDWHSNLNLNGGEYGEGDVSL